MRDLIVPPELKSQIPAALARELQVVPVAHDASHQTLLVAMANPGQLQAIDVLAFATGMRIVPVAATAPALRYAVDIAYPAPLAQPLPRARGSIPPLPGPLPKVQSYEDSMKSSARWMKVLMAFVVLGLAAWIAATAYVG